MPKITISPEMASQYPEFEGRAFETIDRSELITARNNAGNESASSTEGIPSAPRVPRSAPKRAPRKRAAKKAAKKATV